MITNDNGVQFVPDYIKRSSGNLMLGLCLTCKSGLQMSHLDRCLHQEKTFTITTSLYIFPFFLMMSFKILINILISI